MSGRRAITPSCIRSLIHQLCGTSHPPPCCTNLAAALPCTLTPTRCSPSSHPLGSLQPSPSSTSPTPNTRQSLTSPQSLPFSKPRSSLTMHTQLPPSSQLPTSRLPQQTLRSFASSPHGQPGSAGGPDSSSSSAQEGATSPVEAANKQALGRVERKVAMVFTCSKCDTRSIKSFSRSSYEKGVVLVRCPGCEKQHLIADHLGWFGDKGFTVEQLRETGTKVMRLEGSAAAGGLEAEDLIGWSKVTQLIKDFGPSSQSQGGDKQPLDAAQGEDSAGGQGPAPSEAPELVAAAALLESDGVVELSADEVQQWRRVQEKNPPGTKPY